MADERDEQKELERKQVLEDIRRRAEEAELKRIEEEERTQDIEKSYPLPPPLPPPTTSSIPGITPPRSRETEEAPPPMRPHELEVRRQESKPSALAQDETEIEEMRERIEIALERGKFEKASKLIAELREMAPGDASVEKLEEKLKQQEQEQKKARTKKRGADNRSKEEAAREKAQRDADQKKITDLLEAARSKYEQEKYVAGLELVDKALALDAGNEQAVELGTQIRKAQELAEQIKAETARHKQEEAVGGAPARAETPPLASHAGDVWGAPPKVEDESGMDVPAVETPVPHEQKIPLLDRIVERISRVHVPTKPLIITAVIILLGVLVYVVLDTIRSAVFPAKYSMLVFPGSTLQTDSETQLLAAGFTEEIIGQLSIVPDMRVIAPVTAISLKDVSGSNVDIARRLGANYYLRWSLSTNPNTVSLHLTLADTLSPDPVWSSEFQATHAELPMIRNEIVKTLLSRLQVETGSLPTALLSRVPTDNAAAYEAYLRGRTLLHASSDTSSLTRAVALLEEATQADGGFAEAFVSLAWAHLLLFDSETNSPSSHLERADEYLSHAAGIEESSPAYSLAQGMLNRFNSRYRESAEQLERAAAMAPSDAEAQRRLAIGRVILGNPAGAVKAATRAVADDPRNILSYTTLGLVQQVKALMAGADGRDDYKAALQSYEWGIPFAVDRSAYMAGFYTDLLVYLQQHNRAEEILADHVAQDRQDPESYYRLGRFYQSAGKPKEQWQGAMTRAKELLQTRLASNADDLHALSMLALVETRLGHYKEAEAANSRTLQLAPDDVDVLYASARMYALRQNKGQALEQLRKAVRRRYRIESILDMDFYNLHSDPALLSAVTLQ